MVEILQYLYIVYNKNFKTIPITVKQIFSSLYYQKCCYIMLSTDKFVNVLQWKFLFQLAVEVVGFLVNSWQTCLNLQIF